MGTRKEQADGGVGSVWQAATEHLREMLPQETYSQWIAPIVPLSVADGMVKLGVSDDIFMCWLQDNFTDVLLSALGRILGEEVSLDYELGHFPAPPPETERQEKRGKSNSRRRYAGLENCHERHTFENLVVGPENEFAVAAALSVAKSKGHSPANPLFIYGVTGLGKTHIIQAVARKVVEINSDSIVEYVSCEEFLNLFIESIRDNKGARFRNRFRKADYLLIDDIHFIARAPQLQEEFFNTFNKLHGEDKKIILTSDRRPSEINQIEDRLVSRFDSGLTVDIQPPGVETRLAILQKKQATHSIKLSDEVLYFVASRITSNVRRLEGALTRLLTHISIKGGEMTTEMAERILSAMLDEEAASKIVSIDDIQKVVASHFDLRVSDLTGSKRPRNIAVPRMMAMYLARKMTSKSLPEIGAAFDRNHATVVHAVKSMEKKRASDENVRRYLSMFERRLENA